MMRQNLNWSVSDWCLYTARHIPAEPVLFWLPQSQLHEPALPMEHQPATSPMSP